MTPLDTPPPSPASRGAALEHRLCLTANRWGTHRAISTCFAVVSRLGDGVFWYGLMATLALLGGWHGVQAAAHMAATGVAALLLYKLLKRWTRRPRPFRACPGVIARMPPLDEFSFPSGHTLQAVGFTLVALAYYPALAPLLLSFTVLVAISRVVLGLHYPSDVLAACAIGGALGALSLYVAEGMSLL